MRDHIMNMEYFDNFIAEDNARIVKLSERISKEEVREERIIPVKQGVYRIKLGIIIAKYSRGDDINQIKDNFIELYQEWLSNFVSINAYNENLKMISLAVLFGIEQELVFKTRSVLRELGVSDWLLDYLLGSNMPESQLVFPDRFHSLKHVKENNKIELLEQYLKREWYNKDCDCYKAHTSKQKIYYGYWSFEAGAVAKILGIDDLSLKDTPFYPYDLVHYEK